MGNKKASVASLKTKAESSSSAPKKDDKETGKSFDFDNDEEAAAGSSPAVTRDELPLEHEPLQQFSVPMDDTAGRVGAFHVGGRNANTVNDEWLTSEEDSSSESGSEPNDRTATTATEQGMMVDSAAPYHAISAVLVDESEREQEIENAVQEYIRNNPNSIKRRRCLFMGSLLLGTILLVIVIIAIVLSNQKNAVTDSNANNTTAAAPSISPTHPFPTFEPSLPPSLVPSTSMTPSLSPIRISTRQALLDAVDDYLARIVATDPDPVQAQQQPDMMMGRCRFPVDVSFDAIL